MYLTYFFPFSSALLSLNPLIHPSPHTTTHFTLTFQSCSLPTLSLILPSALWTLSYFIALLLSRLDGTLTISLPFHLSHTLPSNPVNPPFSLSRHLTSLSAPITLTHFTRCQLWHLPPRSVTCSISSARPQCHLPPYWHQYGHTKGRNHSDLWHPSLALRVTVA